MYIYIYIYIDIYIYIYIYIYRYARRGLAKALQESKSTYMYIH